MRGDREANVGVVVLVEEVIAKKTLKALERSEKAKGQRTRQRALMVLLLTLGTEARDSLKTTDEFKLLPQKSGWDYKKASQVFAHRLRHLSEPD
jgi:hypothetical protein